MPTNTKIVPDNSGEFVDGVDRHYYANQVISKGPWDTTFAFRKAAAHAKDRARHNQIRAIRAEAAKARGDFNALSGRAAGRDGDIRSIDGVKGAPDSAIKL